MLFTRNVIKIKGAAHKNGAIDGTGKRGSNVTTVTGKCFECETALLQALV